MMRKRKVGGWFAPKRLPIDPRPGEQTYFRYERMLCILRAQVCVARQKPKSKLNVGNGARCLSCQKCEQGRAIRDALDRGLPVPGAVEPPATRAPATEQLPAPTSPTLNRIDKGN